VVKQIRGDRANRERGVRRGSQGKVRNGGQHVFLRITSGPLTGDDTRKTKNAGSALEKVPEETWYQNVKSQNTAGAQTDLHREKGSTFFHSEKW